MEALFALLHTRPTRGSFAAACEALAADAVIRAVTPHGENLLVIAAQYDLVDIAEYLLARGVYKNQPDFRGGTPLMRAAVAKSLRVIDLFISKTVDPRPVSSFSGKRAAEAISYPPLTEYAAAFEARMKNPYFNYRYRVAEFYRTGLAVIAHPNPGFYRGFPPHPLLKDVKSWADNLSELLLLEKKYEALLNTQDADPKTQCLYCGTATTPLCSCGKVRVCPGCASSKGTLAKFHRSLHVNNCAQGVFASYE